ncbi:MAG: M28 family metallopeptidase [Acidobacteriota bacterium]|nr:MAG: M28 family metallopeptidase [Acidobacteriota bacterium]
MKSSHSPVQKLLTLGTAFLILIAVPAGWNLSAQSDSGIPGFSLEGSRKQRALEEELQERPRTENSRKFHRILTADPHVAGTPGSKKVADFIYSEFKRFGLEAELVEYDVLLSRPRKVELELIEPEKVKLANPEAGYSVDEDSQDPRVDPPWHAYSASGEVTADVVYVNYGRPEDYDRLEAMGIDVRGKIAIVKYFKGYRGGKSMEAEARGVRALIIYSDPIDDGYVQGDAYPKGPWGPASHVQRGANVYDFKVPGDPLTPGWPSTPEARRIKIEESEILPKIMTIPLSYADATHILENLSGPVVPKGWQGGLPFTYHVGPGPAKVRLELDITRERGTIYDIIGRIEGSEEPEKEIILSNHHDAWVYGAVDPSSGTATMLELARVLGELSAEGWKPKRTIVFGSWDAEEFTLTGSTEWGEQRAERLSKDGVVCLNVDASTSGSTFAASAVPSLREFIISATRDVKDPKAEGSVYDSWVKPSDEANIRGYAVSVESGRPVDIGILGSGSDYTVFFNHLGIPSLDMLFDGPYGVYHSQYDSYYWMEQFGDPGFHYHTAMVTLWGVMATRLANADILPFDYAEYGRDLKLYAEDLAKVAPAGFDLGPLFRSIDTFTASSAQANQRIQAVSRQTFSQELKERINRSLMQVERDFMHPEGIPGRPWFKHLVYAPLPSYEAETFPGIREAIVAGDLERAAEQRDIVAAALKKAAGTLEAIHE